MLKLYLHEKQRQFMIISPMYLA